MLVRVRVGVTSETLVKDRGMTVVRPLSFLNILEQHLSTLNTVVL